MIASLRAEWLKMRKRPAVWVLFAVFLALLVTLGYAIGYLVLTNPPRNSQFPPGVSPADLKKPLYPVNLIRNAMSGGGGIGSAVGLILGVLAVGSEYGWGTFKTVYTQGPGRLQTLIAKVAVVALLLLLLDVAFFAVAAVCSGAIATLDHKDLSYPAAADIGRGIGAAFVIWGCFAAFGMALAYLVRQSAPAIGLGLVYLFVVEFLIFGILGQAGGDFLKSVQKFFPGPNSNALTQSFGQSLVIPGRPAVHPLVGAEQAVLVLCAYAAAFLVVSAAVVRTRDVT